MSERAVEIFDANGRQDGVTRISFSDVARAHYQWDVEGEPRDDFDQKLERFERDSRARIVDSYWCRREASGVALAMVVSPKRPGPLRRMGQALRLWHPVPEYRLYRETDWVTVEYPRLASLLHACDVLAIKARWGLEGIHEAVVLPWIMAVETHILGYIERDWRRRQALNGRQRRLGWFAPRGKDPDAEPFEAEITKELSRIEDYYQQAGEKRARLHFVSGMVLFGVPLVAAIAVVCAGVLDLFGLLDMESPGVRRFYAAMAAGAVGAIISVLMRMGGFRGRFVIDHELGAAGVRRLGAFRPLIGAVCGVVLTLLVQTTLVPLDDQTYSIEFYVVIAFLAGFSERWTRVVLNGAMRTVEKVTDDDEPQPSEPKPSSAPPAQKPQQTTAAS